MGPRTQTTVVNVTFKGDEWDYDERVTLAGRRYRLVRVGASGDAGAAETLVGRWADDADAIALSGLREARAGGHEAVRPADLDRLRAATIAIPVRDDTLLADIFQEWAIRRVEAEMPGYFINARVVVVGGTTRERTVAVLREFTDNIIFDEAGHDLVLPGQAKTNPVTATTAGIGEFAWRQVPGFIKDQVAGPVGWVSAKVAHAAAVDADVIIGSFSELMRFGLPNLAGKAVITERGLRGPPRLTQRTRRRPRRRRHAAAVRVHDRACDVRGNGGRDPPCRHGTHDRRTRPFPAGRPTRTATAVAARPPTQEPFRVRDPPVVDRVLQERRAARDGHEHSGDDRRGREVDGLHPPVRVQPRDRDRLGDRGRGRGLADHRGRHPEGDARSPARVHLLTAARGGRAVAPTRRPDHGARRVHQGGRRRRRDRRQTGVVAGDHRQQLQRLGCAVGGIGSGAPPRDRRGR